MKKILLNLLSFSENKYYGVGVYFRDVFVKNMPDIFKDIDCEITILYLKQIPIRKLFPFPEGMNIQYIAVDGLDNRLRRVFYEQIKLPFKLGDYNLIYSPNNINPIITPGKCKSIITIHDLLPFKKGNRFSLSQSLYLRFFTWFSSIKASEIITVSNYSKKDISKTLRVKFHKISVTYNVLGETGYSETNGESFDKNFFFTVGALQKDKQLDVIIKAFYDFRTKGHVDYKLMIAGGDQGAESDLRSLINSLGLQEQVKLLGYINEEQKWLYYHRCKALLLLGKNEGFGIPVLEAMSAYKPSIVSNTGALPEIMGNAGFAVNSDRKSVSEAMLNISSSVFSKDVFDKELCRFSVIKQVEVLHEVFKRCC